MRVSRLIVAVGLGVIVGCDGGPLLTDPDGVSFSSSGGTEQAKGEGVFLFDGGSLGMIPTTFDMKAKVKKDGRVSGDFRQTLMVNGSLLDVSGDVTCVTFDHANGRAWIGAVVTENNSEAFWTGEIHEPGRDVWFRVLDGEIDRSTLPGFEGGGGIITSAEYCAAQIWPDGDARTHPVTEGHIKVKP